MKAIPLLALFVIAGVLALLGHGIDDVTNGMSRIEVIDLMGQPKGVFATGTDEVLLFDGATVTLHLGKMTSASLPRCTPHTGPQPPANTRSQSATPPPAAETTATDTGAWQTDFAKATAEASQAHRYLLLDFTGSDWCGFCIKLEKEVFSTPEFAEFAASRVICVRLDFPRKKPQDPEQKKQNAELAGVYTVHSYPTVILLTPDGKLVGRQSGYRGNGPRPYIEQLKTMMADYEKCHPAAGML